jgi:hypothetical protein
MIFGDEVRAEVQLECHALTVRGRVLVRSPTGSHIVAPDGVWLSLRSERAWPIASLRVAPLGWAYRIARLGLALQSGLIVRSSGESDIA